MSTCPPASSSIRARPAWTVTTLPFVRYTEGIEGVVPSKAVPLSTETSGPSTRATVPGGGWSASCAVAFAPNTSRHSAEAKQALHAIRHPRLNAVDGAANSAGEYIGTVNSTSSYCTAACASNRPLPYRCGCLVKSPMIAATVRPFPVTPKDLAPLGHYQQRERSLYTEDR
jgi:hypothetical protein